jgi:hypothetical protein
LAVIRVELVVRDKGRSHHSVDVVLVFTNRLLLLHQLTPEVVPEIQDRLSFLNYLRLHLSVDDLLDSQIRILVFNSVVLVSVEEVSFCCLGRLLEDVVIIFETVLETHFHILHPAIQIAHLSNLLPLPLQV